MMHLLKKIGSGSSCFKLDRGPEKLAYLLPIRLTVSYLLFSIFLYVVGPWQWVTYRPVLFYSLLFIYIFALWFGYRVGLMRKFKSSYRWTNESLDRLAQIVGPLIVINCIVLVVIFFREYGFEKFDIAGLAQQAWAGIKKPGYGYGLKMARKAAGQSANIIGGRYFQLFNYFWSFFAYPIQIFSLLYFKRLKPYAKVSAIFYHVLTAIFYMSMGTNSGIFRLFFMLELPAILDGLTLLRKDELSKKKMAVIAARLVSVALLLCVHFTWTLISRGGINRYQEESYNTGGITIDLGKDPVDSKTDPPSSTETPPSSTETPPSSTETPPSSTLPDPADVKRPVADTSSSFLPPAVMKFWVAFTSYLTQGYYGMSLALTVPWTSTFGLGSNLCILEYVTEHFYDVNQYTYQVKTEIYGWGSRLHWHSFYTWIANDVSFFGVIFVMLLLGVLFGAMYKDAISSEDPFAKISIFYYILIMLFIPCNNQVGQGIATLFSFIFVIICWLFCKHSFFRKSN